MKYNLIIFCLFLLFQNFINAQIQSSVVPDSIMNLSDDSLKIELLLKTGQQKRDPVVQIKFYKIASEIANTTENRTQQFRILSKIAVTHFIGGNIDSLIMFCDEALKLRKKYHIEISDDLLSAVYNNIGLGYFYLKDYSKALDFHLKSLSIRENILSDKLSSTYNNIGLVYMDLNKSVEAIEYFDKSLVIKRKNKDYKGIANTLNNLGLVEKRRWNYNKSKIYFNESLIISKELKDIGRISNVLNNLGKVATHEGNFDAAFNYYSDGLKLVKQQGNNLLIARVNNNIAEMYLFALLPEKALKFLNKAFEQEKIHNITIEKKTTYELFYKCYAYLSDSKKTSFFYEKYKHLHDSLELEKTKIRVEELMAEYQSEKKEREIKLLKQVNKVEAMKLQRIRSQQKWILGSSVFLLFSIAILFWLYRERMKTNEKLSALNSTKNKLLTIIGHDLKNPLIAFRSITQSLSINLEQMDKKSILYFVGKLDKSSNQLYLLIQNLLDWTQNQSGKLISNPTYFDLNLLIHEIFQLFKISADRKNIVLINKTPANSNVHADIKMTQTIFRNLTDNAIKFTPVNGKISISCVEKERKIVISIKDSGEGISIQEQDMLFIENKSKEINKTSSQKGTGIGLILCKELLAHQGSDINVFSKPGEGTTFSFSLTKSSHG
jgi:two-component system, sensor histidine kinase and response regulator